MFNRYTKPTFLAWLFFICGLGTTLALGTWQVQRLAWKEALIADIATARAAAPLTELPQKPDALKALEFQHVALDGAWLQRYEFHVASRYFRSEMGYHIFTPFQIVDGRIVMVNRGWVPTKLKQAASRPGSDVGDEARIEGMIRMGSDRNYFTPPSDAKDNVWFGRDIAEMAASQKLENVIPELSIDLIGTQNKALLPVPATGEVALRNDHVSYIVTWYGIAFSILVIFALAHRKKAA